MSFTLPVADRPNPDNSGGKLILAITGGEANDTHFCGVHIQPIHRTVVTVDGKQTYDYTTEAASGPLSLLGITWAGSESNVNDTFTALANLLKVGYDDTWSISLHSVYSKNSTTGLQDELFPVPNPDAVTGTSSTLHVGNDTAQRVTASLYAARSQGGGRFRLVLPCFMARTPQPRVREVTPTAGGIDTAVDHPLLAYLQGDVSRIVAHNGGQPSEPWSINVTAMANLRRVYSAA